VDPTGALYESTGLVGQSTIRQVDPHTGTVIRSATLPGDDYGEGLALVDDRFIQLTWKDGLALVWDAATLTQTGSFSYTGEGWGLCNDGTRLVMSDGSSDLTFRDLATFSVIGAIGVTFQGQPVGQLNELECVEGSVWANVWETPYIVRIDPGSGAITGVLDTTGMITPDPSVADPGAVLNGIAYQPAAGTFLLTGKRWPSMFEVRITDG
jgi:glutamine cyclotransferase